MPTRPALLLFDLDDVLVRYDHGRRCDALSQSLPGRVARAAGLDAHHFTGPRGLRDALLARGFDLPGDPDAS